MPYPYPIDLQSTTVVTVFDVTDRAAPAIVQKTTLEGSYIESRAVGDFVYVVLSNQAVAPPPLVIQDPPSRRSAMAETGPGVYETKRTVLGAVPHPCGGIRPGGVAGLCQLRTGWRVGSQRLTARTRRHLPATDRRGDEPGFARFAECDQQRARSGRLVGCLHQRGHESLCVAGSLLRIRGRLRRRRWHSDANPEIPMGW